MSFTLKNAPTIIKDKNGILYGSNASDKNKPSINAAI